MNVADVADLTPNPSARVVNTPEAKSKWLWAQGMQSLQTIPKTFSRNYKIQYQKINSGASMNAALLRRRPAVRIFSILNSAKEPHAKGNDQGLVVKDKEMRKTKASTIEEENKPKDEIKEEGSSKKAAKMLNRAINSSDVTKAGAPESLSFSYRPERYDINTMTVEGEKAFTPSHEGEAKKSKTRRSTRLNILRSKQKCFEDNEISRVADTTKATHQLSAKAIEEHGTNKGRGYIQTIRSRRSHGGVCKGNADREKESKEIKRK